MSHEKFYDDPSNRVVCVFDDRTRAMDAKAALIDCGYKDNALRIFGEEAASDIDTSAKWFADTDEEMKKFEYELRHGNTLLSIPIEDSEAREKVHRILKRHDARHITHFGEWVTEVLQ